MNETCYACPSDKGKPRDVAGTRYILCDQCWDLHLSRNAQAVTDARRQIGELKILRQIRKVG